MDPLKAVEENPESFYRLMAAHVNGAWYRRNSRRRAMFMNAPIAIFNGIAMIRATPATAKDAISEFIAEMDAAGQPWNWQVGPSTSPSSLADLLEESGLVHSYSVPAMTMSLADYDKPQSAIANFEIRSITDTHHLKEWADVCVAGFSMPQIAGDIMAEAITGIGAGENSPVRCFTGYHDGMPVSTSCVFFDEGVAGIYCVSTVDAARGNGFGAAITTTCLQEAKARGCDLAMLHSSRMGRKVYENLGFQEVGRLSYYSHPA